MSSKVAPGPGLSRQQSMFGDSTKGGGLNADDLDQVQMEEEIKHSFSNKMELFRLKAKKIMTTHSFGLMYSELLLYLSLFSTAQFIYSTYESQGVAFDYLEMALAALFGFDWMLSFFIADHKIEFITRYAIDRFLASILFYNC